MTPEHKERELDELVRSIEKGLNRMRKTNPEFPGVTQLILVAIRAAYVMGRQHCLNDFIDGSIGPGVRNGESK